MISRRFFAQLVVGDSTYFTDLGNDRDLVAIGDINFQRTVFSKPVDQQ